jgi:Major Facilitator Superfamily
MAGPIVGQVFYSAFGFEGCFYSTTVVLALAGVLSSYFIPERVNIGRTRKVKGMKVKQISTTEETEVVEELDSG